MISDIVRLYSDHGVPYELPGHKHVSAGWVGTPCPFCSGNPGFHLGYCTDPGSRYAGRFVCWRCGAKKTLEALSEILRTDLPGARYTLSHYRQISGILDIEKQEERRERPSRLKFPAGTGPMTDRHRRYLSSRGFDPDRLESEWGLLGTGPAGDYKHRVIIPITHGRRVVSYQGRDITGKSDMKYKACRQEEELRDHKQCLYGLDRVRGDRVLVVEGVPSVWRLGPGTVGTFGVKYTPAQVALLLKKKLVFILFDPEPEAQEQARKLGTELTTGGVRSEIIEIPPGGDPGDLPDDDAQAIVRDLLGKNFFR
jgi:hypothetical protein